MSVINEFKLPDTNDSKYIRIGLSVILLVFGVLGLWSATAKMDSGVPLPGQVVVESNKKVVQHLEGGIIQEIYVKDGDFVKKGTPLLKFDDTKARTSLQSLEANYFESLAMEGRLIAQNTHLKEIKFSPELKKLEQKKAKKLQNAQVEIFKNMRSSLENEKKISKQKIASLTKHIDSLNKNIKSKNTLLNSYKDEAKEQQELFDEHLIDKVKLREVKRKIESIESDISTTKADITKAEIQINEVQTQYLISKEKFFTEVKTQLREIQTSLEDMKARIAEVKDRLSRTYIKAPASGTILDLQVHTIGAVVSPGRPILEIVPDNSRLIIRGMLSPEYIDYVRKGLKANITFPAFKLKSAFIKNIQGEVIFVAADSTTDEQGNSYYTVKLIVDNEGIKTLKEEELVLQAGMPSSIVIKIGQQTMLDYLIRPITTMLDRAFLEE